MAKVSHSIGILVGYFALIISSTYCNICDSNGSGFGGIVEIKSNYHFLLAMCKSFLYLVR